MNEAPITTLCFNKGCVHKDKCHMWVDVNRIAFNLDEMISGGRVSSRFDPNIKLREHEYPLQGTWLSCLSYEIDPDFNGDPK